MIQETLSYVAENPYTAAFGTFAITFWAGMAYLMHDTSKIIRDAKEREESNRQYLEDTLTPKIE